MNMQDWIAVGDHRRGVPLAGWHGWPHMAPDADGQHVSRHELKFSFTIVSLARPQYPNVCSNIILGVSVKILFRWD